MATSVPRAHAPNELAFEPTDPCPSLRLFDRVASCLVSLVVHAILVIWLGFVWFKLEPVRPHYDTLLLTQSLEIPSAIDELPQIAPSARILPDNNSADDALSVSPEVIENVDDPVPIEVADIGIGAAQADVGDPTDIPLSANVGGNDYNPEGALSGRSALGRTELALNNGGSLESEAAVARGLRWLQGHQQRDGSWHFNHHDGVCQGACANPGSHPSTTGATALALLAFLGNGQTHREGDYQDTVQSGLYYLTTRMLVTRNGGDLQEGTMYAQGLATIALCEAYAMTRDESLREPAQQAVNYIVFAQDPKRGGWRYYPGEPGDTTVTGWQLMALKSAQMAYLAVPPDSIDKTRRFLDSVQSNGGAQYSYQPNDKQKFSTTSVGLLCRMYTGWHKDHPGLKKGIELLGRNGPSKNDMYYNYYATQVMHHWGGEPWRVWNYALREYLIENQARNGHEAGSWFFNGPYSKPGGRLLATTLSIMTLEVYYRHLPIYRQDAVLDDF